MGKKKDLSREKHEMVQCGAKGMKTTDVWKKLSGDYQTKICEGFTAQEISVR